MDLDQGTSGNANTVTNAYMFYGVYNLPTVGTYSTVTNGYGIFVRNEAVGGTGQMLDAAFYADDKSHSGSVKGWDFGIDFSGVGSNSGGFGTADIRGALGETIVNSPDGTWDFGAASLKTDGGTITTTEWGYLEDVEESVQDALDSIPTEDQIEAYIFDADNESVSGVWTNLDNIPRNFGTDNDFKEGYFSASDRLEWRNSADTPLMWLTKSGELGLISGATPAYKLYDSDAAGADRADEEVAFLEGGFSTTTEDAEVSDFALGGYGGAVAGTRYTNLFMRNSTASLYMGVLANYTNANPSVVPLDVADYESLMWDFDYAENTIGISSPVSGTTKIDWGSLNHITTGTLSGRIPVGDDAVNNTITKAEMNSIIYANDDDTWVLDDIDAADGTGWSVCVYQSTAAITTIDPDDEDMIRDTFDDGGLESAGELIASTAVAGSMICLVVTDFTGDVAHWSIMSENGTWTPAD